MCIRDRSTTVKGLRWYYRLSLTNERKLNAVLGDVRDMPLEVALARLKETNARADLVEIVTLAAAKCGDIPLTAKLALQLEPHLVSIRREPQRLPAIQR